MNSEQCNTVCGAWRSLVPGVLKEGWGTCACVGDKERRAILCPVLGVESIQVPDVAGMRGWLGRVVPVCSVQCGRTQEAHGLRCHGTHVM